MNKQELWPPKHASASDWDFTHVDWLIQTEIHVSPPSALRLGYAHTFHYNYPLCKAPGTLCLPQGRIITWFRHQHTFRNWFLQFRNTAPPGSAGIDNCYLVNIRPQNLTWHLSERQDGAQIRDWLSAKSAQLADTWYHFRLSWWLTWDLMLVTLELEIAGEWVQQGIELNVPNPLHGDAEYQRPGTGAYCSDDPDSAFIDDTEIWKYP